MHPQPNFNTFLNRPPSVHRMHQSATRPCLKWLDRSATRPCLNCPKLSTLTCTTAQTGHKHHAMRFPDTVQGLEERNPGKVAAREDDATTFPSTFHRHPTHSRHTFHRHPPHSTDTLQDLKERKPGRSCTKQREDNGTMRFPPHKGTMRFPPHSTDTLQGLEERKPASVECRWRAALLHSVQH